MSSAVRHPREDSQDVIVLDSDDEAPTFKQSEVSLTRLSAHQHAWHALCLPANLSVSSIDNNTYPAGRAVCKTRSHACA